MFTQPDPQPNFALQEEEILAFWQREKIFEKSVEKNKDGGETYVIYDGPPYANAKPPLHTMVPMSFKDLVGRYKTMRGYYVPRQAGWDTHGLPIEVQVEKKLGLTSKKDILNLVPGDEKASIKKFNDICRESVFEFKKEWNQFIPRTGYWTDLEHPYITYEPEYISKAWGVFKEVFDKDLAYKGYKVLPYCYRCGTSLSAAEVALEYQDVKDVTVYASFPLKNNPGRSFLAWTTTPWTLPGNVALAVGPTLEYVVVKQEAGEYIVAKSRLEVLKGDYEIVEEIKGADLAGLEYEPIFPGLFDDMSEKKHYILAAEFVTDTDGTGIVHIAPMYGEDDFNLGLKEGLPQRHTVGTDGAFTAQVTEFAGQNIREALVPILQSLTEKNRLYGKQSIAHSYPFCWRCKTPLIYYAKDSWFISMSSKRAELVKNNKTVKWIPEHIRDGRFGEFVKEARDWAVSRERFWGIPLPVWVSKSGKNLCIGSLDELRTFAKDPSQIGGEFDPHRPMVDDIILVKDGEEYFREPFVLDIWFDSGAMPYASGRAEQGLFPADYIAEAVDQTRGWFYSLMALGTILKDKSPYKHVVCMGHLVDETGKKMSKSLGNVFDPWEMFKVCGADALRWWLYTVNSPGESKALSIKELQTSFRKSQLLLWNVFNYFVTYANLHNFTPGEGGEVTQLDRWMLSQQATVTQKVTAHLDNYDFMRAGRLLESYIGDLSTWYLRRSRKREDVAFFQTMYEVLLNLSKMLAPFVPFMAEKLYQVLRQDNMPESVHLTEWPGKVGKIDPEIDADMAVVRRAVELGLSTRSAQGIKVRQPLATAFLRTDRKLVSELRDILAEELNVLEVEVVENLDEGYPQQSEEGVGVALDVTITDDLAQAGAARELLRHIQQLRKQNGLNPGQLVSLVVDPSTRYTVEPLIEKFAFIRADAYLSEIIWEALSTDSNAEVAGIALTLELRS